ncbi:zinc finger protein (macronuclear) [Tetrahymena thermophila SB210]|uniref:Zinc finger protein n=1 Tax=Tetrahymena thermophila (strain SB210) TaxID=312017 RepID=Q22XX1_TETTS|nr:zinc finger protein [Tetrahymena thermophila SB210]EAR90253.2 zinc finger protein [Tetrahymena thermophila SB210]|eukprot:XP_001010498.2 zinc finger protein [Tetrahymena thermophila SB210]
MNQKAYKQPLRERNQVELKFTTWDKDSHGLFDYESESVQTEKHRVDNPCQIVRQDNKQIKIVDYNERIEDENCRVLASITQKDSIQPSYYINPSSQSSNSDSNTSGSSSTDALGKQNNSSKENNSNNDAYLIVRFLRNQKGEQKGYPLQVGDMIKLGRVEYCVIEKYTEESGLQQINDIFCDQEQYNFNIDYSKTETKTCRICLCEEEQCSENPLLNPCNCKGSCEYMHFECLKHWVESKVHKKYSPPFISTFKWKNLECEVCKQPLPKIININNKKLSLVETARPEGNYIILESISREKKVSMGLYIINNLKNPEDQAKLGRGHTCDIRVQDISVSRFHSYIKYENGQFLLFDNNSKFGTLVKLDKNYPILSEKVGIQVGRTIITFSLKPSNSSNLNQLQQSLQQSVAQFDKVMMNNSQKQKQNQEQQQVIQKVQQFKNNNVITNINTISNINSQNTSNNSNNNGNIRIPTNTNIPQAIVNNNNTNTNLNQQQKNNNNNIQAQLITSSSAILDKLQKGNSIKQPNKGNTFVSNAANNIIGGNSSQVQGSNVNRNNIQNVVLANGSMANFNSTQYKIGDVPLMNNYPVSNSNTSNQNSNNNNNNNNNMFSSSHVMGQNNRNSSNVTHYNEFPNFNSMNYNQANQYNIQNNFQSTLYTNLPTISNNNNTHTSNNHNNYGHYAIQQNGSLISRNNRNHH